MFITIAVIFVLLASFLLIIVNMYSDYVARREQDARLISTRARNIITECEELLLNQAQVAFSKTLVLVLHYRIIRALRKRAIDPKTRDEVKDRIANEEKIIAELCDHCALCPKFRRTDRDIGGRTACVALIQALSARRKIDQHFPDRIQFIHTCTLLFIGCLRFLYLSKKVIL